MRIIHLPIFCICIGNKIRALYFCSNRIIDHPFICDLRKVVHVTESRFKTLHFNLQLLLVRRAKNSFNYRNYISFVFLYFCKCYLLKRSLHIFQAFHIYIFSNPCSPILYHVIKLAYASSHTKT